MKKIIWNCAYIFLVATAIRLSLCKGPEVHCEPKWLPNAVEEDFSNAFPCSEFSSYVGRVYNSGNWLVGKIIFLKIFSIWDKVIDLF